MRLDPVPLEHLAGLLPPERAERLRAYADIARTRLDGRIVWNVSATATGGGVAEMLQALLGYSTGAGIDARWLVLDGSPEFFQVTKRVHNLLHGFAGDGGPLGDAERRTYEAVMDEHLEAVAERALIVARPRKERDIKDILAPYANGVRSNGVRSSVRPRAAAARRAR